MKTKIFLVMLTVCGIMNTVSAQNINRTYRQMSLSKVLEDLGKATNRYTINFIYNELEDFTITADICNSTIPDAVRRVCELYPMKITFDDNRIYVECTQKAERKLIGKVVDSHHQPVAFANVTLLSPADSGFVNGGVTNNNGDFVVPCDRQKVVLKVSCIGYRTLYRTTTVTNMGTLKLANEAYTIKGVVVKGDRPQYKMSNGGLTVDIEHSLLSQMGSAADVLAQLPRVKVSSEGDVSVFAKGTPLIYINNKPVRDKGELQRLKSTDIKSVDIITNPGARYAATVESVIRIKTFRPQGDGFSARLVTNMKYNKEWAGNDELFVKYRNKGWEVFADLYYYSTSLGEDNHLWQDFHTKENHISIDEKTLTKMRFNGLFGQTGWSYDINEDNSVGMSYSLSKSLYGRAFTNNAEMDIFRNGMPEGRSFIDFERRSYDGPSHEWNAYFIGKIGKTSIDFNGTYIWKKTSAKVHLTERSDELDNRDIHYGTYGRNNMLAGKIILSHPVGKGTVSVGSEVSHTNASGLYEINTDYVSPSKTDIKENNIAGFAEMQMPLGQFSLNAGLRFEHVSADYYSFGVWQQEPSRNYNNWFPNFSVSWNGNKWAMQLNYVSKTERPSYSSLRNEKQYDNRYMYEGGNPYLRPSIKHNLELNMVRSWLSVSAGYTYSTNAIVWVTSLYENKEISFLRNMNFDHAQDVYASVSVSPKFGWYEPSFEVNYSQQIFDSKRYGSSRDMNKPEFGFTLRNRFVVSPSCFALVNINYSTESCSGFVLNKESGSLNVGLVKSFMNKALTFNLFANDLLKTNRERWMMYGQNVILGKDCYNYSRKIGLTVTYNFNATRSKYKGTGAGNEEKRRL